MNEFHEAASAGPRSELTVRAVVTGLIVAAFIGASYPFIVLKLGFGPNISVVSAFLGYIVVNLFIAPFSKKKGSRFEYNIVQTAGTAAGESAFMVILLAAFDLLAANPKSGSSLQLSAWQIFSWLSIAGCLGVLLAVPLRRHYIDEEELPFADGLAAGETMLLLDQDGGKAKAGVRALMIGGGVSAVVSWFRDGMGRLNTAALKKLALPDSAWFGSWGEKLHVGFNWSLLSVASGLLIGVRVSLSMGLGMVVGWYVLPPILSSHGFITSEVFRPALQWIMWPAVGLMVAGGLTGLALKWRLIIKTFEELSLGDARGTDLPLRFVFGGAGVLAVALVVLQKFSLGMPVWLSVLAILISAPLMLVGIRVLGETNWAPISAMANLVQVFFAAISPGSALVNMVSSGMSGTIAGNGEHLMQDYKAGKLIGSNNRSLTLMQLCAVPVGALALSWIYPRLRFQYGIGPERFGLNPALVHTATPGLVSPASVRWAGFAEVLSHGVGGLPPYCLHAFFGAMVLGVLFTLGEQKSKWVPSATSVGLGMLIEAHYVLPIVLGGILSWVWQRTHPASEKELAIPLASGMITGEALMALIITVLLVTGVLA